MGLKERQYERCPRPKCNDILYTDTEIETGICGNCADRLYQRFLEREEFDYYHPTGD